MKDWRGKGYGIMGSNITEFIQRLADTVPCVLRIDFEVHAWSHCQVVLHCAENVQVTEMVSTELIHRKDPRLIAMLCQDLRHSVLRALTDHRAEQWQAQKSPGQCVALLKLGEFHGQMTVWLPPPPELCIDIPIRRTGVKTRLMFVLASYDPMTHVAVYRT